MSEQIDKLVIENLVARYSGRAIAVAGVSLRVKRGEFVAVGGLNGAGKTSLLRCIAGALRGEGLQIVSGRILIDGRIITRSAPWDRASLGVAFIPDRNAIFTTLTVDENLRVPNSVLGQRWRGRQLDLSLIYDVFPVLARRARSLAGYLSGGERRMLAIGMAITQNPSLLLVDELTMGLAPTVAHDIALNLVRLREHTGVTVVWVDQFLDIIAPLSDRWMVMRSGAIVGEGSGDKFDKDRAVSLMYGW